MAIKYEVDGDIFREINEKWLVAYVQEFLIKARAIETDAAGNKIELLQLNDGRLFSRSISRRPVVSIVREPNTQPDFRQSAAGSH